jgi:ATP-binding cassette, subfamily B (MDR/TAP), member 1
MGDGLVLEHGTHNELLGDENGAYFRLVHAQKLRERRETTEQGDDNGSTAGSGESEELEKAAPEEPFRFGRKNTEHSLASEILEKRQKERRDVEKGHRDPDYSLPYLFKRMGRLNREGWTNYTIGAMFAIGMFSLGVACISQYLYF